VLLLFYLLTTLTIMMTIIIIIIGTIIIIRFHFETPNCVNLKDVSKNVFLKFKISRQRSLYLVCNNLMKKCYNCTELEQKGGKSS